MQQSESHLDGGGRPFPPGREGHAQPLALTKEHLRLGAVGAVPERVGHAQPLAVWHSTSKDHQRTLGRTACNSDLTR
jgi:hypothetical protein